MEKIYTFRCESCKHEWNSNDYNEDAEGKEGYWAQGFNCPKCESRNISGEEKE